MTTANTFENTLTLPVGAVAMPAFVASLGRVTSVCRFNLDAVFTGDMPDFGKERRERPSVVDQSALFESALSNVLDNSALENLAGAGCGDTDDTGIDANCSVALRVGNILCNDQMQIPDLTFAGDGASRLNFPRSVEVLPVVARKDQVDSNSACKRGQRGVLLIDLYCQRAGVVSHRRRVFPSVVDGLISLVSFRHNAAGRANEIGGELCQLTHVLISDVVKSDGVKYLLLKGDIRGVVERNCVGFLSLRKRLRGLLGCLKFYLQCNSRLHMGNLYYLTYWYCKRGLRYAKPTRNAKFLCRL